MSSLKALFLADDLISIKLSFVSKFKRHFELLLKFLVTILLKQSLSCPYCQEVCLLTHPHFFVILIIQLLFPLIIILAKILPA
jgi:hypothetical protein